MSTNPVNTNQREVKHKTRHIWYTHSERKKYNLSVRTHTAHEGFKERKDENCAKREERREINMFGIK